jgi:ubiquinone/menaquinone biosynthesis C-methylase UbiE
MSGGVASLSTYDRLSRWYDWLAGPAEEHVRQVAVCQLAPRSGEVILDIGCGTGQALRPLVAAVGAQGKVYGLDLAAGMLAVAQAKVQRIGAHDRFALVRADALGLPFRSAHVDAVLLTFALELFAAAEIGQVLGECRRVLRAGGRVCVAALAAEEHPGLVARLYARVHHQWPTWVDCRPICPEMALAQAGFAVQMVTSLAVWGLAVKVVSALAP